MADNVTFTVVIHRRVVHFLMSLNAEKHCLALCLFFNEHELCAKTAWILSLFFNEYELCAKTARLTQSYDKNVSLRFYFLWSFILQSFALDPFVMQVRKRLILRV